MNREKTWRYDLYKMGAKSYGSSRKFGAEPEPLQEILRPEFFPWRFVIFYDEVAQFCDFFGVDDKFNLEVPSLCDPLESYESMPDYA